MSLTHDEAIRIGNTLIATFDTKELTYTQVAAFYKLALRGLEQQGMVSVPRGFLEAARCPECSGVGWNEVVGSDGEPEQQQCQWCDMRNEMLAASEKDQRGAAAPNTTGHGRVNPVEVAILSTEAGNTQSASHPSSDVQLPNSGLAEQSAPHIGSAPSEDQLLAIHKDQVEWVVNDNAELGVKIGNQFFWLYKGYSLVYGDSALCKEVPSDGICKHDNGTQMYWRPVKKREFGECCYPVNHKDPTKWGTVSLDDSSDWKPLPSPHQPPAEQVDNAGTRLQSERASEPAPARKPSAYINRCPHEWYQGRCIHCDIEARSGRPKPDFEELDRLRAENVELRHDIERHLAIASEYAEDAELVCQMLELGDQRLLASDGPAGGQLPELSPKEWGKVYRACKRIAARKETK